MPSSLAATCQEGQSDAYFTLETQKPVIRSPLKRNLRKARQNLRVEFSCGMPDVHQELMHEFVARTMLSERVKGLLFKMPQFVACSDKPYIHLGLGVNAGLPDQKFNLAFKFLQRQLERGGL